MWLDFSLGGKPPRTSTANDRRIYQSLNVGWHRRLLSVSSHICSQNSFHKTQYLSESKDINTLNIHLNLFETTIKIHKKIRLQKGFITTLLAGGESTYSMMDAKFAEFTLQSFWFVSVTNWPIACFEDIYDRKQKFVNKSRSPDSCNYDRVDR